MMAMKQLPSADFRKKYTAQSEPVEVTAHGKVIGTWIPTGADNPFLGMDPEAPVEVSEVIPEPRMTIRPVVGKQRTLVATSEKRVMDPLEAAKRERANYSVLASRMYGPRTKHKPE